MIGEIGITALMLLAVAPEGELISSLVELCNNRIDMGAITILRKELQYFQRVLSELSYDYYTMTEDGNLVKSKELNAYSKALSLGHKTDEEKSILEAKLKGALDRIPHTKILSDQQEIAGEVVLLSGLEKKIVEYYANNTELISHYLHIVNQNDVIHDTSLVFGQKLYRLPGHKPIALYYRVADMLRGKKTLSKRDLEEIQNSALAVKFRFVNEDGQSIDLGEDTHFIDICTKRGVFSDLDYQESSEVLDVWGEIQERIHGLSNSNKHKRAIVELARDIFYFCKEVALLNAIFCPGEEHTLEEFEAAFGHLDAAGFFGLTLHGLSLYADAIKSLSLLPDEDITFTRTTNVHPVGYGQVIDRILAFCKCNSVAVFDEIKEEM